MSAPDPAETQKHEASSQAEPMPRAPLQRRSVLLLFAASLLAAALATVFWLDARHRIVSTQDVLARRLRDIELDAREARSVAGRSQEALREAQAKIVQLDARLAESQNQQAALQTLYQDLSRDRDEWQLAEIEQVLNIAQQQLELAGNVRAALLALQLAESRLERSDRAQFLAVRRALARDIERLKALPALDLPGVSARLDSLAEKVDTLPLAFEERMERAQVAEPVARDAMAQGFWARLSSEVWAELRQLVVVRQLDRPEPPLLPPDEAYFLRQNLRLRLLSARLNLLVRDPAGYREDVRQAQDWVRRYFDPSSSKTADALALLKQLASNQVTFDMPSISDSLEAVRAFKVRRERAPR